MSTLQLQMVADDTKVYLMTGTSCGLRASIVIKLGKAWQKVVVNYAGSKNKTNEVVAAIKEAGGNAINLQANCEFFYHFCTQVRHNLASLGYASCS